MIKQIINFTDSMNNEYENISLQKMKDFIFNKSDDFWAVGSGTSKSEFFLDNNRLSYLTISASEKYGFLISCGKNLSESLTLLDGTNKKNVATLFIAGDLVKIYQNAVVSKELAWEAIEYFFQTGHRKESLIWGIAETPDEDF